MVSTYHLLKGNLIHSLLLKYALSLKQCLQHTRLSLCSRAALPVHALLCEVHT